MLNWQLKPLLARTASRRKYPRKSSVGVERSKTSSAYNKSTKAPGHKRGPRRVSRFGEPSPVSPFKDGFDLGYLACLQEAGQMYALISGDATASGESRIQALADFLLKIMPYKSEVDHQGSWVLTVVLLLASALSDTKLADTGVVYDSRVHVATLSSDERTPLSKCGKTVLLAAKPSACCWA
jgi:hypothetical protein